MHAYEFLQRYGPAALVIETGGEPGAAFAAELAKGGFDLLLPCADATGLAPLAARLEDHEGVDVELFEADIGARNFPETLYPHCEHIDIGLLVCGIDAGHSLQAGSLITSLTRVFLPRLRRRRHSGVIVFDMTGKARRFGETLAYELHPEGIDVLMLCAEGGGELLPGATQPRQLAKTALQHIDRGPVLAFDPQSWGQPG